MTVMWRQPHSIHTTYKGKVAELFLLFTGTWGIAKTPPEVVGNPKCYFEFERVNPVICHQVWEMNNIPETICNNWSCCFIISCFIIFISCFISCTIITTSSLLFFLLEPSFSALTWKWKDSIDTGRSALAGCLQAISLTIAWMEVWYSFDYIVIV